MSTYWSIEELVFCVSIHLSYMAHFTLMWEIRTCSCDSIPDFIEIKRHWGIIILNENFYQLSLPHELNWCVYVCVFGPWWDVSMESHCPYICACLIFTDSFSLTNQDCCKTYKEKSTFMCHLPKFKFHFWRALVTSITSMMSGSGQSCKPTHKTPHPPTN